MSQHLLSIDGSSSAWLERDDPWRAKALQALQVSTGYTSLQVETAIDAVFGELTKPSLEAFYREHIAPALAGGNCDARTVLHVAAGNVFTAWLHGVVITLLLGHKVWIKPSSTEPIFAALWEDSLKKVDPSLATRVKIVSWRESLPDEVDAVVAYGSDETLELLRAKFSKPLFIGYGHKWSFGIVFSEALSSTDWPIWRERLRRDAQAFQLQGCLSPQLLFVQGNERRDSELKSLASPSPIVQSFSRLEAIRATLPGPMESVTCIGVAGADNRLEEVKKTFGEFKNIRFCRLGEMQQPPLSWRNGGVSLAEKLCFRSPDHAAR